MWASEHVKPEKSRAPAEKQPAADKNNKVKVPEEWKLTPEQQDFIDLFNQDENKKQ